MQCFIGLGRGKMVEEDRERRAVGVDREGGTAGQES